MKDAVHLKVCLALLRSELAGYQGYPHTLLGEERFAKALQEVAISVDHLKGILSKFTQKFPTVQDIMDVGLNLLPQFQIPFNQLAEWERECGPPRPLKPDFTPANEPPYMERDRKIKEHLTLKHGGHFPGFAKIGWLELFEAQEACGYPLTPEQAKMIGR